MSSISDDEVVVKKNHFDYLSKNVTQFREDLEKSDTTITNLKKQVDGYRKIRKSFRNRLKFLFRPFSFHGL